jgi:phenylpropionate dioxygenase-like ring-hydroxylating dioxygenase large terminal subunit
MVTAQQNRLLTQSGPGTAAGAVLRRYWQPAALAEELGPEVAGDRPVVPVTLLGEDLLVFRDEVGRLGLIGRHCPHRGVDLTFGRLEDGGLRCPLHGWLLDVDGRCLETPAEPETSTFHTRVSHRSYPVREHNGVVWAYLGPDEPPPLPGLDAFAAPASHVFAFKGMWHCNWLQAHEVGIDPAHAAFLHRFLDEDTETLPGEDYGQQFRDTVADSGVTVAKLMREASAPSLTASPTPFGFRLVTLRRFRNAFTHVRLSNCIFPNAITIAMSREIAISQWHVPIDDERCYWYAVFVSFTEPVDATTMRAQRITQVSLPDYAPLDGAHNRWGYDPEEQRTSTYTGMGRDINVHDQYAVESPGPIYDRTTEHLSPVDVGIRTHRRLLLAAIEDPSPVNLIGRDDPAALRGPVAIDAVSATSDEDDVTVAWSSLDRERRAASPWATPLS